MQHVLALAGHSGSGKTFAAHLAGIPTISTDAFFRDSADPLVPQRGGGPDWDDLRSFNIDAAIKALTTLMEEGRAVIPIYDYALDRAIGTELLVLPSRQAIVIEGIFAFDVAHRIAMHGVLVTCVYLTTSRLRCFSSRILRDVSTRRLSFLAAVLHSWRLYLRHAKYDLTYRMHADWVTTRTLSVLHLQAWHQATWT